MKTKILASISGLLVSLLTPLAILVPQASAAVVTWDGEGADNNFSTATNWSGDTVPVNGDSLTFDVSILTQSETLNNDLTLNIVGMNLIGTQASNYDYTIQGNDLTLSGDVTGNPSQGNNLYLDLDVTLGANITYSVANSAVIFGIDTPVRSLDLSTYNLNYTSPYADCFNLSILASLSGSGNIISSSGSSEIVIAKAQTAFTGDLTINGFGLSVYNDVLLGFNNTVTMNGSSILSLVSSTSTTFDPAEIVMNSDADAALRANYFRANSCGGAGTPGKMTTTIGGGLTLMRNTIFSGTNDLVVDGTYTSNGNSLTTKSGSLGSITTSAGTSETQATTTTINADDKSSAVLSIGNKQTVVLNGERGIVSVGAGGVLKGTGKAGDIYVDTGGKLAPGLSPGCISSSNLTILGTYEVEIAGTTVCTEYDQTVVTGTVDVTGGTLQVLPFLNSYKPADNTAFMIISNDAADAVVGTFAGLADGATFAVAGYTMQINYNGGDGNDVMLLVTEVPAAPDTGIGSALTSPLMALGATLAAFAVVGGLKFADRRQR
jgi:hypothetical protein